MKKETGPKSPVFLTTKYLMIVLRERRHRVDEVLKGLMIRNVLVTVTCELSVLPSFMRFLRKLKTSQKDMSTVLVVCKDSMFLDTVQIIPLVSEDSLTFDGESTPGGVITRVPGDWARFGTGLLNETHQRNIRAKVIMSTVMVGEVVCCVHSEQFVRCAYNGFHQIYMVYPKGEANERMMQYPKITVVEI